MTAAQLRQRMERLLCRVAPRVISEPGLPAGRPSYGRIEPAALIEELQGWTSTN